MGKRFFQMFSAFEDFHFYLQCAVTFVYSVNDIIFPLRKSKHDRISL